MLASIAGYVSDGSSAFAYNAQPISIPAGETGTVSITVRHADGTAFDLTGCQLHFLVPSLVPTRDPIISRQATIISGPAGTASFPLVVADTLSKAGPYLYEIWLTDSLGARYRVVPPTSFSVAESSALPGQTVTVPASQEPLAQGPAGPTGTTLINPETHGILTISGDLEGGSPTDTNWFEKYAPTEVAAALWARSVAQYANAYGTRKNQVMRQGWNLGPSGRITTGEAAIAWTIEHFYQPTNIKQVIEAYLECFDNAGNYYRPIGVDIDRINATPPNVNFAAGLTRLQTPGNVNVFSFNTTTLAGAFCQIDSLITPFYVSTNNIAVVRQKSALGAYSIDLVKLDATDRVVLGVDTVDVVTARGLIVGTNTTNKDAFVQAVDGVSAAVAPANTGRLRYNKTAQQWEQSANGGAYAALASAGLSADGRSISNLVVSGSQTGNGVATPIWTFTPGANASILMRYLMTMRESDGSFHSYVVTSTYTTNGSGVPTLRAQTFADQLASGSNPPDVTETISGNDIVVNVTGYGFLTTQYTMNLNAAIAHP